jgi:toxin HigB-1
MIRSFRNKELKKLFEQGRSARINSQHQARLLRQLDVLDAAISAEDMNLPGWYFHPLQGKLKAFHAVSVSGNWRLIFRWQDGAWDVDYLDYH